MAAWTVTPAAVSKRDAYPVEIEIGILRGDMLQVERFQNRSPHRQ